MSVNQKFQGLAVHAAQKGMLRSSECWELVRRLKDEMCIDVNHLYVVGFEGESKRLIEKGYKVHSNSGSSPHPPDIEVWLYLASAEENTWFGAERETGSICFGNVSVEIRRSIKRPFMNCRISSCMKLISEYYNISYGYYYPKARTGYINGGEFSYNWLTDCSTSKDVAESEFPKSPVLRWQWYLRFAAPRIGQPPTEASLVDERAFDLRGVFRDVYPYNILSPEHLKQRIGGKCLRDWILESSHWGELNTIIENELYLWTVNEDNFPAVRESMIRERLLVAHLDTCL